MTMAHRFWFGALGGFLPALISLLSVDIGALIDNPNITTGHVVGAIIRYAILLILGGVGAMLNDENKPFKLVQLGIAAPAVLASLVNAQANAMPPATPVPARAQTSIQFDTFIFSRANAAELYREQRDDLPMQLAFSLKDVARGIFQPLRSVGANVNKNLIAPEELQRPKAPAGPKPLSPAEITQAQRYLVALGYRTEAVDGKLDSSTIREINEFKTDQGLPVASAPDLPLLNVMKGILISNLETE